MKQEINTFLSLEDAAKEASAWILARLRAALVARTACSLVLSGGSSPKALYRSLAREYADDPVWRKVCFFWGDERLVPPEDKRSNYGMALRVLLEPLGIPENRIFRIPAELPGKNSAEAYARTVGNWLSANGAGGFDVTILGLGGDGHTASLFPDSPALADDFYSGGDPLVIPVPAPVMEPRVPRVTMTLPLLRRSASLVFFVAGGMGGGKKSILDRCRASGFRPTADIPATLAVRDRSAAWFICGEEA
ncbi:MAG: 6-phosphogluconolactonase [Spirochaetales bacterium]|nr:MAG: 6-phosphogluconolactonase [Spirochaetales bacterium]